jgi:putative SOS response-associated peptidase YedK
MVTQPPGALGDLHDRAPVVLRQEDWARWLDLEKPVDDLLTTEPADLYIRPFHEVTGGLL